MELMTWREGMSKANTDMGEGGSEITLAEESATTVIRLEREGIAAVPEPGSGLLI